MTEGEVYRYHGWAAVEFEGWWRSGREFRAAFSILGSGCRVYVPEERLKYEIEKL